MTNACAWYGEPALKEAAMAQLREHRRLDQITQGTYWREGRGCHLGCLTHLNEDAHAGAERLFNFPQPVSHFLERVFESLPKSDAPAWVINSTEAIPVGADLSLVVNQIDLWILRDSDLLHVTDENRKGIQTVIDLHIKTIHGELVSAEEWSAARSAAYLAAQLAAESAARSAARSAAHLAAHLAARSAAYSAARSAAESAAYLAAQSAAESAAYSAAQSAAESAAYSAARSAAWRKIASQAIKIFSSLPIISCPACEESISTSLNFLRTKGVATNRHQSQFPNLSNSNANF